MKKIYLLFIVLLSSFFVSSQINLDWATQVDKTAGYYFLSTVQILAQEKDASGNIFVTGEIQGTVDFDPTGVTPGDVITSTVYGCPGSCGNRVEGFIAKYNSSGAFQWVRLMPNLVGTGNTWGSSLAVDASGSVFVHGMMYGSSGQAAFIGKYNSSGTQQFMIPIPGYTASNSSNHLTIDVSGNLYIFQRFDGTEDLDPGPGTISRTAVGAYDFYLARLNPATGAAVWVKTFGGTGYEEPYDIETDGTYLYVTGGFTNTVDFNPDGGVANRTSAGNTDIVIARYLASTGAYNYAYTFGGANYERGYNIELDLSGSTHMYWTTQFQGTIDFQPGAGVVNLTARSGAASTAILRVNKSTFAVDWADTIIASTGQPIAIDADASGFTMIQSIFNGPYDFDPGPGVKSLNRSDFYTWAATKYDNTYNMIFAEVIANGASSMYYPNVINDGSGGFYYAGDFHDTVYLDPSALTTPTFSEDAYGEAFVSHYIPCSPGTTTITGSTANLCESSTRTFSATPTGGTWSVLTGGGSITSGGVYTPANVSALNTTVQVRYQEPCGGADTITFIVNGEQNVSWSPTLSHMCEDQTNTLVPAQPLGTWTIVSGGGSMAGNVYTPPNITIQRQQIAITRGQPAGSACTSPNNTSGWEVYGIADNTTSTTSICSGATKTLTSNPSGGSWSIVSGGGVLSVPTYTAPTVSVPTSVTLRFTYTNPEANCPASCKTTIEDVTFTVNPAPSQPSVITGSTPICSSSQTYSVTNVAGVTYAWTYSGGGTPTGSTNSTTFTPTSSGTLSVTATNACGTSSPRTLAIVVDASAPAQPSTITGNTNICSSSQTYSVTNVAGVTYAWTYSGGGTPSGTTNSTTFTPTSSGTLSVTASNACGTSAARTLVITVSSVAPSQPSAITGTTPVCSGSSQTYSVTNVAGVTYAWSYSGTGTPTGTTNSTTFTPTSNGTLTVTASNACGTSTPRTLAIVVDASAPAQPSVITGNTNICSSGQTYSVTNVAGVTYAWSYSGTGTPTGTTNTTTFTPTTSGTLSVTASNSCGTSAARTLAITVYSGAPATPGAITGTSNFCRGTSQSYSIGAVANATSYTWSYSGTPSVSSTTTSVTFTPLTSGVLSVTATNACGTSAARNLSLTVDTTFPASIISSGFDMCVGDARTLVGSPVGGTFSVISGGAFGSVTGNTLNANAVGTVQIRYRITNACGNMDDTQSINIVSTSAASITSSTAAMCIGDLRGLTGTPTGGSFSVIGGPGYIGLNDTLTANASGTVQVEYQYISPCGVTADTVSITINPEPVVTITSSSSDMCIGGTRALTGTPAAGTWSVLSGPGTITGSTLTATGAGNIQIEYTASALGCPGSTTQTITVLGSSDATWTNPGNICESAGLVDLTTYLPGTSTPGGVWSGSTSVSAGGILNTAGLGGTTINIKYKVGPSPCADSLTLPVTISIAPDASWSIPSTICESQQFDLDTLLSVGATTGGTWSGPGVTGSIFDPYGLSGPVTIKYVVSNANCSDSLSQTVNNILTAPTAPTVTLSSDTICDGNGVTITASGSGSNVAYNVWDSPTGGNFLGQTPLTLYPTSNTTYYVEAYGANLCSQVGTRTSTTVVVDILAPISLGGNQTICLGNTVNLSVPNNPSNTYLWSDGGTTNTFSVTPSSSLNVWVSETNNLGCVVSDTIIITVNGLVPVIANNDLATVVSERTDTIDVQINDAQFGAINIISLPSNGTAIVNGSGQIEYTSNADFTGEDVLSYEICDALCAGICDTAYVNIRVEHNVFDNPDNGNIGSWGVTPNGDGINDVLLIDGLFEYPDNEITIYNRWGDEIYNAKPYGQDWDGQNPKKFVNGTYFFILKIEGKPEPFKGFIHLQK